MGRVEVGLYCLADEIKLPSLRVVVVCDSILNRFQSLEDCAITLAFESDLTIFGDEVGSSWFTFEV